MVIALLLAQLVLPGPPSGPIQPPGMICASGACEGGPAVYRTSSDRGRLVVACDMTSDTCSDGRQIATTRATPVPCETSPGVWETVGVDEGCYGVRGLESWGANTSYLSWGAELDRSSWLKLNGASVEKVGSHYRVCGSVTNSFVQQLSSESGGQVRAAACRVRAGTSSSIRLLAADISSGGVYFDYTLTEAWQTVTATATIAAGGGVGGVRLLPSSEGEGCIEVAGCWSVRGPTPGRPCWGGESPVHCDGERVTISTAGWPTEEGEICGTVTWGEVKTIDAPSYFIDGRYGTVEGTRWYIGGAPTHRLSLITGASRVFSPPLTWEVGRPYRVCVERDQEGRITHRRDGVVVVEESGASFVWGEAATLGGHRSSIATQFFNGSLRSLTVRSSE